MNNVSAQISKSVITDTGDIYTFGKTDGTYASRDEAISVATGQASAYGATRVFDHGRIVNVTVDSPSALTLTVTFEL